MFVEFFKPLADLNADGERRFFIKCAEQLNIFRKRESFLVAAVCADILRDGDIPIIELYDLISFGNIRIPYLTQRFINRRALFVHFF